MEINDILKTDSSGIHPTVKSLIDLLTISGWKQSKKKKLTNVQQNLIKGQNEDKQKENSPNHFYGNLGHLWVVVFLYDIWVQSEKKEQKKHNDRTIWHHGSKRLQHLLTWLIKTEWWQFRVNLIMKTQRFMLNYKMGAILCGWCTTFSGSSTWSQSHTQTLTEFCFFFFFSSTQLLSWWRFISEVN